jgi:hypothetical protein
LLLEAESTFLSDNQATPRRSLAHHMVIAALSTSAPGEREQITAKIRNADMLHDGHWELGAGWAAHDFWG